MLSWTLLLMLYWQSAHHQVTATFLTPDEAPLVGIRVRVSLPEREGVLVTDQEGRISFNTWSDRVYFAVAGPTGNHMPYVLPDPQKLHGERVSLTMVVDPAKIPGGGKP